jgi:hypothetical protein
MARIRRAIARLRYGRHPNDVARGGPAGAPGSNAAEQARFQSEMGRIGRGGPDGG